MHRTQGSGRAREWAWGSVAILALCLLLPSGCGDDNLPYPYGSADNAGQTCATPAHCYQNVDHTTLAGAVICLDRVENGYCTHECNSDADCCAVPNECWSNLVQVCSPFESTDQRYCFLGCEDAEVADGAALVGASPEISADEYCSRYASPSFHCRSSGGGSANRRVCVP
jgi:hypothetical protein